tara:strand:- start:2614 stop:2919 length:306 start_codon:yes stop_codon:yes gene_type:complete
MTKNAKIIFSTLAEIINLHTQKGILIDSFLLEKDIYIILKDYLNAFDACMISMSQTLENTFSGYYELDDGVYIPFNSKLQNFRDLIHSVGGNIDDSTRYYN